MLKALVNDLLARFLSRFSPPAASCTAQGSLLSQLVVSTGSMWKGSFSAQPCEGQVYTLLFQLSTCLLNRQSHICFVFCLLQHPLQWLSILSPIRKPFSEYQLLKLGLFLNCFFYGFVKDLSWVQILYKIPLQLWFISSPFLQQYFRSGLNLLSLTSLHSFYIALGRLHFIAGVLFLKAVDCDTIAKRKTFVKVQLVMHSYHPLKRFS